MDMQELMKKYNAEPVGGRLIAHVNGKREYIADYDGKGFRLTDIGLALEEGELQVSVVPVAADAPKKRRAKAEAKVETEGKVEKTEGEAAGQGEADVTDLLAGLDAGNTGAGE